ncbi:protein kinase [Myxococcota bacterium]|nr:protein kinase [Myxococcota bacterium]
MDVRLQERLITSGLLSQDQLNQAIQQNQQQGGSLREALVGLGYLSDTLIQRIQAEMLGKKFYTLEELLGLNISTEPMQRISYTQALEWMVLPHGDEHSHTLELICASPPTLEQQRLMTQICNAALGGVALASHAALQKAIRYHYGRFMLEALGKNESDLPSAEPTTPQTSASAQKLSSTQSQILLRQEALCPACQYPYERGMRHCMQCGCDLDTGRTDPLIGEVVGKRWRLLRQLGEGGMGLVYQGQELDTKELCAIKFLRSHAERAPEEKEIKRFEKEAQILSDLHHPHILQLRAYGVSRSLGFYLVTEFLDGLSLDRYAEKHAPYIPFMRVCQILCQVCEAMDFAHQQGVIHRDIKPENIFMTHDEQGNEWVKIIDFGIAHKQKPHEARLTSTGMMIGTPRYIAPEQILGKEVGTAADIYALSVILFELLTFKDLFVADNVYEYLMRHVYAEPPRLQDLCPERHYPRELQALVDDGLAKKPEHRPASMNLFRERLLRVAALPWARQEKETGGFLRPGFDVLRLSEEIAQLPTSLSIHPPPTYASQAPSLAFAPTDAALDAVRRPLLSSNAPSAKPAQAWPHHLDPPDIWVDDEPSSSKLTELSAALDKHYGGTATSPASSKSHPANPKPQAAKPHLPSSKPAPPSEERRLPSNEPTSVKEQALPRPVRASTPRSQALWTSEQTQRKGIGRWLFLLLLLLCFGAAAFVYFFPQQANLLWLRLRLYTTGADALEKQFPKRKKRTRPPQQQQSKPPNPPLKRNTDTTPEDPPDPPPRSRTPPTRRKAQPTRRKAQPTRRKRKKKKVPVKPRPPEPEDD